MYRYQNRAILRPFIYVMNTQVSAIMRVYRGVMRRKRVALKTIETTIWCPQYFHDHSPVLSLLKLLALYMPIYRQCKRPPVFEMYS